MTSLKTPQKRIEAALPSDSLLQVDNLGKSFGGVQAVDGISFELHAGELLAMIGPNGAGKSTTFNMLNGQLKPDQGSMRLNGVELVGLAPREVWRLGVGRSFQIAQTFASLSVLENVQMAFMSQDRKLFSLGAVAAHHRRHEALQLLESVGMADQAECACSALAYGDVKRVELAMALANAPKLLLMDEPTAGMAVKERHELMALIQQLARERHMAVLFTEHSMDVVFAYASRILVLARGQLIAQGNPQEIRHDARVREVYFGSGKTFEKSTESSEPSEPAITTQPSPSLAPTSSPEILLDAQGLCAWYGAAQILYDLHLHIRRGEVVALMGRNGAGKSTTLKTLMGLMTRRRGQVRFMGHDISQHLPHRIASLGMGYVPEDRRVFTDLSVSDNLDVGRQPPRHWPDGQAAPVWTPQDLYQLFPNLGTMPHRMGGHMSGGEQQMLTVARTLMGNPFLVLLDEPSEGVAPVIVEQMAHMILALKHKGVSILLSEQNLHFAELVCDRAYVLEKGHIQFEGSMEELCAAQSIRQSFVEPV